MATLDEVLEKLKRDKVDERPAYSDQLVVAAAVIYAIGRTSIDEAASAATKLELAITRKVF
jgi:hypothetical protein